MIIEQSSRFVKAVGQMLYRVCKLLTDDSALIIVDPQNDFCPDGTVPVPKGDQIMDFIYHLIWKFFNKRLPIILTRDWHLPNTNHFKANGGEWEIHCVQNTTGAEFHPKLVLTGEEIVISKGMVDGNQYSGFEGVDLKTGLSLVDTLKKRGVHRLFIGGLATDYCVKNTALDALKLGYEVFLLTDAIRAVDKKPRDGERAIVEMVAAGAVLV